VAYQGERQRGISLSTEKLRGCCLGAPPIFLNRFRKLFGVYLLIILRWECGERGCGAGESASGAGACEQDVNGKEACNMPEDKEKAPPGPQDVT
jgi:hypothetical protein